MIRRCLSGITCLVIVGVTVSGCALPQLDSGELSGMDASENQTRNSIVIEPFSPVLHMRYHLEGKCLYSVSQKDPDGTASEATETDIFTPHRDKIFISSISQGRIDGYRSTSFAAIGRSGRIIDYNAHIVGRGLSASDTPQTAGRIAQEMIQKERRNVKGDLFLTKNNLHELNGISLEFPHYISKSERVGEVVAYVSISGGGLYGTYTYRGITDYDGHRAALLDLSQTLPGQGGVPITTGFGLFDVSTGLPRLIVISAEFTHVVTLLGCQP